MKKKILIIILALIGVLIGLCVWYVSDYYHVVDRNVALADTNTVQVSETDFGYSFDGPGEDSALIFYPGANVEDLAYADLLKRIAAEGVDCYLASKSYPEPPLAPLAEPFLELREKRPKSVRERLGGIRTLPPCQNRTRRDTAASQSVTADCLVWRQLFSIFLSSDSLRSCR